MTRQHSTPLLIPAGSGKAVPLKPLAQLRAADGMSEAEIQQLVHAHPECLPIAEIDPMFANPVSICTELSTPAGLIDIFMVTASGLPVLVECKLWRNPQGRREVIGQILDYAKELSRWSSSDLQREVSHRLKRKGNPLLDIVQEVNSPLDEMQFNDALTQNLRRGRFLLLIVGDGIREGVEAITEYLQQHAGLHFSLGLVELPIYTVPDGCRLVVPRILARTSIVTRTVMALPDGYIIGETQQGATVPSEEAGPDGPALAEEQQQFWREFLPYVKLDDPEQPIPKPARLGYLGFMLPAPSGSSWLTVYRDLYRKEVGIFLSSHRNTAGDYAMRAIADEWDVIKDQLGGSARLIEKDGRLRIADSRKVGPLNLPEVRSAAFGWLAERVNTFVNVLRPRVRSAAADYQERSE